jgi:hypothetical protein
MDGVFEEISWTEKLVDKRKKPLSSTPSRNNEVVSWTVFHKLL